MKSVDISYLTAGIDYNDFFKKIKVENKSLSEINAKEINKKCINKAFMIILAWEKWVQENACYMYIEASSGTKNYTYKTENNGASKSFSNLEEKDIFPLGGSNGNLDRLLILDFTNFIKFIGLYEKNQQVPYLEERLTNVKYYLSANNKTKVSRIDEYIDRNFSKFSEAEDGFFLKILSFFGLNKNEILKAKDRQGFQNHRAKLAEYLYKKGKQNKIFNNIETIKSEVKLTKEKKNENGDIMKDDKQNTIMEDLPDEEKLQNIRKRNDLIKSTVNAIIAFVQDALFIIENIYKIYNESAESVGLNGLVSPISDDLTGIEDLLAIAKPPIVPAFKKSYLVRENNLKPFVNIKMQYNIVGNTNSDGNLNKIVINNFSVPYNNILSMEHSVKEHSMTINLIDTEGQLSELLIQKMYMISTSRNNVTKTIGKDQVDLDQPYLFIVEYGWSGPLTDDEEELLEERVFTKIENRGFIKNISSQYSFKGTEYTLTISPLDQENLYKTTNAGDSLYTSNTTEVSIGMGLIALYLCFNQVNDRNKRYIPDWWIKKENIKNFQQLFEKIENASIYSGTQLVHNKDYENTTIVYKENESKIIETIFANTLEDQKEAGDATPRGPKVYLPLNKIKGTTSGFEKIEEALKKDSCSFNAWIAAIYVIWKLKRIIKKDFIYIDNTGLFDVFDYVEHDKINDFKIRKIIEKFNVLYLSENQMKDFLNGSRHIFQILLEKTIEDSTINEYDIADCFDIKQEKKDVDPTKDEVILTFFGGKLKQIFKSITNIASNVEEIEKHNLFIKGCRVNCDYDTVDLEKNDKEQIILNYRKKIYADENVIYSQIFDEDKVVRKYDKFLKDFGEDENKRLLNLNKSVRKLIKEGMEDENTTVKELNNLNSYISKIEKHILYISYVPDINLLSKLTAPLSEKVSILGQQLVQSYSFTPRISPATRNANKQFFSQGNRNIVNEGSGDIIEFSIDPIDIGNFNSIMLANKNKNNFSFGDFQSNKYSGGIYENAAKYYRTYRNLDGNINKSQLMKDISTLTQNYQSQTVIKGSITIIGEPYWSYINFVMQKVIYIHVYYANGTRSSHSGVYYVSNAINNISEGKFTTKLEIIRAPTFLSNLEKVSKENISL